MRILTSFLLTIIALISQAQPVLLNAHSHNDYTRKNPLFDALDNGFFSIEIDIFYENGAFIVAHTTAGIRKKNTLERLYLKHLHERVKSNNGKVYKDGPLEFEVMIDLKGHWDRQALDSLNRLISRYRGIVTVFKNGMKSPGAIRLLLSGGGAKYLVATDNPRYFSVDGRLGDFESKLDSSIICRTSASYGSVFKWRGRGVMPENERLKLMELVRSAHANGRKIRFWASPDNEKIWAELLKAGVDWINVDKLGKFRQYLTIRKSQK